MDNAILNPFSPHYPIEPRLFVGRSKELSRLEAALAHAKAKRPFNFMVLGERGIGKTSLINYVAQLARSYGDVQNVPFNYIVVHITLDDYTSHLDFFKKFELAVRREIEKSETARTYLDKVWQFIQNLELGVNVAGVGVDYKYNGKTKAEPLMWEEFARSVLDIVERTCSFGDPGSLYQNSAFDGMLILIDEADKAPRALNLGSLLKYLTEYLLRNNCKQVMVGLSGLPTTVDVILDSHKSALRVFEEIRLERLKDNEVRDLLAKCQLEAELQIEELKPNFKFKISDKAVEKIVELSEGHPHILHQIGYASFNVAQEREGDARPEERADIRKASEIELQDVLTAAFGERGAIDTIGDIYFREVFEAEDTTDDERRVLSSLSEYVDGFKSTAEIAIELDMKESEVRNLVRQLNKKGLAKFDPFFGEICLVHRCFAYWLQSQHWLIDQKR